VTDFIQAAIDFIQQHQAIFSAIGSVFGAIGAVLGIFWWLVKIYTKSLDKRIKELQGDCEQFRDSEKNLKADVKQLRDAEEKLEEDCKQLRDAEKNLIAERDQLHDAEKNLNKKVGELQADCRRFQEASQQKEKELQQAVGKRKDLVQKHNDLVKTYNTLAGKYNPLLKNSAALVANVATLDKQIAHLKEVSQQHETEREEERNSSNEEIQRLNDENLLLKAAEEHLLQIKKRIDNLAAPEGRIWTREISADVPAFRSRKTPIISVLNFKGGVGKTTITANLAGRFAQLGKKVLLVDLDYQRSLSLLFLPSKERELRHSQKRCLQHFLGATCHDLKTLVDIVGDSLPQESNIFFLPNSDGMGKLSVFPNSQMDDSLEETEARLMINWFYEKNPADIRFFLRQALHDAGMESRFDYVLLDCPPRLTTASVNALGASDFVLIPVELDQLSASSVRNIHRGLKQFIPTIFPELKILGVVANQVNFNASGNLGREKQAVWDNLSGIQWGEPTVYFFKSKIKSNAAFGKKANSSIGDETFELAIQDAEIASDFEKLAKEIAAQIEKRRKENLSTISA
jgi:cellulose biosynthesis protein BcsQ